MGHFAPLLTGVLVGVLFVGIMLGCYEFAWGIYDTKYNFLGRPPAERREAFKTEAAFYYNFFEDVVEEKTFEDGLAKLAAHPAVEAPKTIDAIMRFNIHPEMAIAWVYRWLMEQHVLTVGFIDSIVFYTRATMFLFGVDKALLFLASFLGSGGGFSAVFSALTTVIAGFGNVNYYSRIWNHPPLREHFGMPFVSLQYVGLFLLLPVSRGRTRRSNSSSSNNSNSNSGGGRAEKTSLGSQVSLALGFVLWCGGVAGLILCWQLGLFILFGQVTSMLIVCGVYKHNAFVRRRTERLLQATLLALLVTLYYQHGNPLTLHSLTLSFVAAAVLVVSVAPKHFAPWKKVVTARMHPIAEALLLCVASAAVMIVLKKVLQFVVAGGNEGDHIFAVLMTKLGYDEYENLDTVLYNTMAVFNTNWGLFHYLIESNLLQLLCLGVIGLAIRALDEMNHSAASARAGRANANGGSSSDSAADKDAGKGSTRSGKGRFKLPPKKAKKNAGKEHKAAAAATTSSDSATASAPVAAPEPLPVSVAAWLIVAGTGAMWTMITCIMFRFVAVAMPHWQLLLSLAFSQLLHKAVFSSFSRFFGRNKTRDEDVDPSSASGLRRWMSLAHVLAIVVSVYSYGQTARGLYAGRVGAIADGSLSVRSSTVAANCSCSSSCSVVIVFVSGCVNVFSPFACARPSKI
mgnify:CR=1 FL=1